MNEDWEWLLSAYLGEIGHTFYSGMNKGVVFIRNPEHRRTLEKTGLMTYTKASGEHIRSGKAMRLTDAGRKRAKEIYEQKYPRVRFSRRPKHRMIFTKRLNKGKE
jgi:hypothetical protein